MIGFFDERFWGEPRKVMINGKEEAATNIIVTRDKSGPPLTRYIPKQSFVTWEYFVDQAGLLDSIRMDITWSSLKFVGLNSHLGIWKDGLDKEKYFLERATHFFKVEKRDRRKRPVEARITNYFWPARGSDMHHIQTAASVSRQMIRVSYPRKDTMVALFSGPSEGTGFAFYDEAETWQQVKNGDVIFTAQRNQGFMDALKMAAKM